MTPDVIPPINLVMILPNEKYKNDIPPPSIVMIFQSVKCKIQNAIPMESFHYLILK